MGVGSLSRAVWSIFHDCLVYLDNNGSFNLENHLESYDLCTHVASICCSCGRASITLRLYAVILFN